MRRGFAGFSYLESGMWVSHSETVCSALPPSCSDPTWALNTARPSCCDAVRCVTHRMLCGSGYQSTTLVVFRGIETLAYRHRRMHFADLSGTNWVDPFPILFLQPAVWGASWGWKLSALTNINVDIPLCFLLRINYVTVITHTRVHTNVYIYIYTYNKETYTSYLGMANWNTGSATELTLCLYSWRT